MVSKCRASNAPPDSDIASPERAPSRIVSPISLISSAWTTISTSFKPPARPLSSKENVVLIARFRVKAFVFKRAKHRNLRLNRRVLQSVGPVFVIRKSGRTNCKRNDAKIRVKSSHIHPPKKLLRTSGLAKSACPVSVNPLDPCTRTYPLSAISSA